MASAIGNADNTGKGSAVDWWFMYKVPENIGPSQQSTGFEYFYFDSNSEPAEGGESLAAHTLDKPGSALEQTLAQLFSGDPDVGYVLWNDELPDAVSDDPTFKYLYSKDSSSYGHTKGVLGFNAKAGTAFYLVHSTPKFPEFGQPLVPSGQAINGQTFLCVSLSYAAANDIAEVLRFNHRPQVYTSSLPGVTVGDPLEQLVNNKSFPDAPSVPHAVDLSSVAGVRFRLFGKNKKWSQKNSSTKAAAKDFWADLVGPSLLVDLNVETWRNGTPLTFGDFDLDPVTGQPVFSEDGSDSLDTLDVLNLDLGRIGITGWTWPFTKDHAKWGISEVEGQPWAVVADLNRQVSQSDRGGGGMAFQCAALWGLLRKIEVAETTAVAGDHKDVAS